MKQRAQYLGNQLLRVWTAMPLGQRLTVALLTALTVGAGLALEVWASTPQYEAVFVNLPEEEAAKVAGYLRENNMPHQLAAGGRIISVPSERAAEARLQLAGAGLGVKGQAGFELFNQASFGLTEQMQRVNYQRAVEGELVRTIKRMDAVEDARVHLVLPTSSLFAEKRSEASASVVLSPRPGRHLGEDQVQAVLSLVLGGVEGLKPENVSIVDTRGRILNDYTGRGGNASGARASSSQYQQQRRFEADLSAGLTSALERVVGPGSVAVRVAATFNWDQVESQREYYDPASGAGVLRSQRQQSEVSSTGGSPAAGGVPGTTSNVPTYQATAASAGTAAGGYERKDTLTNYEVGKTVERLVKAPGVLQKVAVVVMVDEQKLPTEVTTESLEKLVATAANLDLRRGDTVVVSRLPFNTQQTQAQVKEMEEAQLRELLFNGARYLGLAVVPLLLFFALRSLLGRAVPVPAGMEAQSALLPPRRSQPLPLPEEPIQIEDTRARMAREQLTGLAQSEPEMVSALIHTWLGEEER
ncbi:MAG: flagellar M-ring protein FliF [Chloroflexi bacterium]|nr:flagellar M-ring protein FliF [Chloroflexota bacterium]